MDKNGQKYVGIGTMNPNLDRYFKKQDGTWGMIHIGCSEKATKEERNEVFENAVRRDHSFDILMEAPDNIHWPVVACSLCGKTGKLNSWRENKWLVPKRFKMNWRPEGWKIPEMVEKWDVNGGKFLSEGEKQLFEAGADAMLEALAKESADGRAIWFGRADNGDLLVYSGISMS